MVDSGRVNTQNKGVNVTSETFIAEENYSQCSEIFPSLYDVRNQLINVIDVMGPTSQMVASQVSRDADIEDSVVSSTSIFSSVLQVKHRNVNKDQDTNSPRDVSNASTLFDQDTYVGVHDLPHEMPLPQHYVPTMMPPAVLCMNPNCMCSHSMGYIQQKPAPQCSYKQERTYKEEKKTGISKIFGKFNKSQKEVVTAESPKELYKMNIMQPAENGRPRRFVFDLIERAPKPTTNTTGTNTKVCNHLSCSNPAICFNEQLKKSAQKRPGYNKGLSTQNTHYTGMVVNGSPDGMERLQTASYYKKLQEKSKLYYKVDNDTAKIDVYYFDHGNAAYYRTTDSPPIISTELIAEKTENYAIKFWAELFGSIYICAAFVTSFILQLFRFLLHSIVRPLTVGVLQLVSDYFFKPLLAALFNAVIQPPLIFLYNIATSLRDLCDPLAEGMGYYLREIAVLCKSIRLFELRKDTHNTTASSDPPCVEHKCECITNNNK